MGICVRRLDWEGGEAFEDGEIHEPWHRSRYQWYEPASRRGGTTSRINSSELRLVILSAPNFSSFNNMSRILINPKALWKLLIKLNILLSKQLLLYTTSNFERTNFHINRFVQLRLTTLNHAKTSSKYLPTMHTLLISPKRWFIGRPLLLFNGSFFDCYPPKYIAKPHFRCRYTLLPVHQTQYRHLHSRQGHPHPSKRKHPQRSWTEPCYWGRLGKLRNRWLPGWKSWVMQVGYLLVWMKGWIHLGPSL